MQVFATGKATARGIAIAPKLHCKTKYRYAVLVMKLTAILLLVGCVQLSARGISQTITISVTNADLQTVFSAIEKQTDYVFFVKKQLLQDAKRVTLKVSGASLQQVLDLCFKDQPFTYLIAGKMITISRRAEKTSIEEIIQTTNQAGRLLDVKGRVIDENGTLVEGVNVMVKGTSQGTTTNLRGEFFLKSVHENAILLITSVGYNRQEILVKSDNFLSVQLKIAVGNLDEMQVIAYGTTSKRLNTGNVATVKAADIQNQPVQNPLLALQGRVPGVVITQANGVPGGGVTVRIQGQNSIAYGNNPLYVIDGVPYFSQLPSMGFDGVLGTSGGMVGVGSMGSPFSYINTADIESIDILKDADATAIYGSRAANGAILITTKKGKAGQMKLDVNVKTGYEQVAHKWNMLNTRQYLNMRYEALKNDGINLNTVSSTNASYYDLTIWDTSRYTDWQQTLIGGTAHLVNANASISGGNQYTQYLVSGTYTKETTVFPGDFNNQKASVHFNINSSSANQKLHLQVNANYLNNYNRLLEVDLTGLAVKLEPVAPPLYNDYGTLNWAPDALGNSTWDNPMVELQRKYNSKTQNLVGNIVVSYKILPGLDISNNLGLTRLQTSDYSPTPLTYIRPERRATSQRSAYYGNRNMSTLIDEPQITYKMTIGKGKLDFLLGATIQQNDIQATTLQGQGYNSDDVMENMRAATTLIVPVQYITQYKYNAVFGRINYNWANKYVINLNGRRDGTSRFGTNNRFHNFGSVAGAWIFTEEPWLQKQKVLSFGKLKASYGTTGSDDIGDYAYMSLYDFLPSQGIPYQNNIGIQPRNIPNSYLQWEETRKLQAGIELAFASERIVLNTTYSRNRSSNQLLTFALPSFTGFSSYIRNFPALVQNTSWEVALNTTNFQSKFFKWTSNINVTIPANKLVAFSDLANTSYVYLLSIGQPLNAVKTFHAAGVNPSTGLYQYLDFKGNVTASPTITDLTAIVNISPKFYGGFQNNLQYKGIQLDFLFQFVKQLGPNYLFRNGGYIFPGQFAASFSNQPVTVLNRWKSSSDVSSIAKFTTGWNGYLGGDFTYIDASYIRLKNISLSWQLPVKWREKAHFKDCRFYIQGQNLLTVTNWKGLDPETQSVSTLPPLRIWAVGLQVGF
jgi:TonB-linked SusC/RagA family outer membrane protein